MEYIEKSITNRAKGCSIGAQLIAESKKKKHDREIC